MCVWDNGAYAVENTVIVHISRIRDMKALYECADQEMLKLLGLTMLWLIPKDASVTTTTFTRFRWRIGGGRL